jgi:hypothetical protein
MSCPHWRLTTRVRTQLAGLAPMVVWIVVGTGRWVLTATPPALGRRLAAAARWRSHSRRQHSVRHRRGVLHQGSSPRSGHSCRRRHAERGCGSLLGSGCDQHGRRRLQRRLSSCCRCTPGFQCCSALLLLCPLDLQPRDSSLASADSNHTSTCEHAAVQEAGRIDC